MKHIVKLKNGAEVPALGLGTWYLGDDADRRAREIAALRTGIEKGMTLIDTAEMYGGGRSERLVGEAIKGTERARLFIVSKVLPDNAGRRGIFRSCEESLQRLGTDYLDLYLLHWRGKRAARGDGRVHGEARARRPDSRLGSLEFRHGRYGGAPARKGRRRLPREPGALPRGLARHRVQPSAADEGARRRADGLLPARAGRKPETRPLPFARAERHSRAPRRDRRADIIGLGDTRRKHRSDAAQLVAGAHGGKRRRGHNRTDRG